VPVRRPLETSLQLSAYFGGGVLSAGGGVALGLPGGGVVSDGGMVVVVPGDADWSVEEGAGADVSAGGELAEPPGEVDSCFEQADNSASVPTHNNRTLRFIDSPHCVTLRLGESQTVFRTCGGICHARVHGVASTGLLCFASF
jgi:hypothetical protein